MFRTGLHSELLQHNIFNVLSSAARLGKDNIKTHTAQGELLERVGKILFRVLQGIRVRKDKEGSWERLRSYRHTLARIHTHAVA